MQKTIYIYIYTLKNAQTKTHTYLIYTQKKNMWQHFRYPQVKHGPPKIPAESQNLKCLAGHLAAKTSHLIPLCTVDGSKLWKNLLKLGRFGSEYPTLCRLLYLTGG